MRRTLGVHLGLVEQKLRTKEGRYYPDVVEAEISRFLNGCEIDFHPTATSGEAKALERELIRRLKPRLNVRQR